MSDTITTDSIVFDDADIAEFVADAAWLRSTLRSCALPDVDAAPMPAAAIAANWRTGHARLIPISVTDFYRKEPS